MSARVRLLHVDDDAGFADLTAEYLEQIDEGFAVETAHDAAAALEALEAGTYDCVVSDYNMPGRSGLDLLRAVRERDPDLPFVLFTGRGSEEVASEAISAGVTDYLQKETGLDQYEVLANRVRNAVSQYRAERTARWLRDVAHHSDDVLWVFAPDWGELLFINDAYEEVWGQPRAALEENPTAFFDAVHPDDRERVAAAAERLAAGEPVDLEFRVNEPENYDRWVWVKGRPIRDATGEVVRLAGFSRDVTERRRRERTLQELHSVATEIARFDTAEAVAQRTVEAAQRLLQFDRCVLGLERDGVLEPVGVAGDIGDAVEPMAIEEGLTGRAYREDVTINAGDIAEYPEASPRGPFTSALTVPVSGWGTLQAVSDEPDAFDETDRELAEVLAAHAEHALERLEHTRELTRQRDRFEAMFESNPDPIVHVEYRGDDPVVRGVNAAFEETFGVPRERAEGRSLNEVIVPEDRAGEAAAVDREALERGHVDRELERLVGDERRRFRFRGRMLGLEDGTPEGIGVYSPLPDDAAADEPAQ